LTAVDKEEIELREYHRKEIEIEGSKEVFKLKAGDKEKIELTEGNMEEIELREYHKKEIEIEGSKEEIELTEGDKEEIGLR